MQNRRKSLDWVHDKIRFKHYSISTEKTYVFKMEFYNVNASF